MDKLYKQDDNVEALDTFAAVWRPAVVRQISPLSVTVFFPGFPSHKCKMTEDISEDMKQYPSKWPIRHRHSPPQHAPGGLGIRELRGCNKLPVNQLPVDKADKLILTEKVSRHYTCIQDYFRPFFKINRPFFKSLSLKIHCLGRISKPWTGSM